MGTSITKAERIALESETVQLLPPRMEMALVNVHLSGNGNGNKNNILGGNR